MAVSFEKLAASFEKLAGTFATLILVKCKSGERGKNNTLSTLSKKTFFSTFFQKSCKNIFQEKSFRKQISIVLMQN